MAQTDEEIEFQVPEANGTARGVLYDSHTNRLTLNSDIHITTVGPVVALLSPGTDCYQGTPGSGIGIGEGHTTWRHHYLRSGKGAVQVDNNIREILADGNVQGDQQRRKQLTTCSLIRETCSWLFQRLGTCRVISEMRGSTRAERDQCTAPRNKSSFTLARTRSRRRFALRKCTRYPRIPLLPGLRVSNSARRS